MGKRFFLCFVVLMVTWNVMAMPHSDVISPETMKMFSTLDSILGRSEQYNSEKQSRIQELRNQLDTDADLQTQYWLNHELYQEYYVYETDSAMAYTMRNMRIAREEGNIEHYIACRLQRAFVLSNTGMMEEALAYLIDLNKENLPPKLLADYYFQMNRVYSSLASYAGNDGRSVYYTRMSRIYADSAYMATDPSDEDFLIRRAMCVVYHGDDNPLVEQELLAELNKGQFSTRHDAMIASLLSRIYNIRGDRDRYIWALVKSAIADIRSCNRDINSLRLLAEFLADIGDLQRAYAYISYCQQQSQLAHNRVRLLALNDVQTRITQAVLQNAQNEQQRNKIFITLIVVIVLLLTFVLFGLIRAYRDLNKKQKQLDSSHTKLQEQQQQLSVANTALVELNSKLEQANTLLRGQNDLKEEYIGYVFAICSNYISKLDDYRKDINRKIKGKMFEEVRTMTDKPTMTQAEIKEFCHNFDTIFLHVYPEFVEDFNDLLLPEGRIYPRDGEILNTDLRIYALIRLGITDSTKIADFLHCSPQTVYNNRLKIRNKAIIPKEQFLEKVRNLGR